jgi:hypothetical protein
LSAPATSMHNCIGFQPFHALHNHRPFPRALDLRCKMTASESTTFPPSQPLVPCRSPDSITFFRPLDSDDQLYPRRCDNSIQSFSVVFIVTDTFFTFFLTFLHASSSLSSHCQRAHLTPVVALTNAGARRLVGTFNKHVFKPPLLVEEGQQLLVEFCIPFSCLCVHPVLFHTYHSALAFTELSATSLSISPFGPLPLSLPPTKQQCQDATLRNPLCPLQVIPLVPCKWLFRLMVRVILSSSQYIHKTHVDL